MWPQALIKAFNESDESRVALGLSLVFLDKLLLADSSIPISHFEWSNFLDNDGDYEDIIRPTSQQNMIIDAQAIEHLDIIP